VGLTGLTLLHLWGHQIGDISSLIWNEGVGAGDYIWLSRNPFSSVSINIYIPQLEVRRVDVAYWNSGVWRRTTVFLRAEFTLVWFITPFETE
jgi:hypothetical protein